ncbi:HAD hydrolase-like protein [Clostridium neonatale]|uniref:HAD hydrolase-like protein n=1 Tax=Clostridium neonatale TaxID=137838 RepID=UPI00338EB68F
MIDILCGLKSGVDTAAVFTGETNEEEIKASRYKPTHIFNSVKDIYKLIKV